MVLAVVLRVVVDPLNEGRLVGRAEFVESGAEHAFRSAEELVLLCAEAAAVEEALPAPDRSRLDAPSLGTARVPTP